MIDQRPLDALEVEDHPEIELREVEDGQALPHLVVGGVGVAAHVVGEKVEHSSCPHWLVQPFANTFLPVSKLRGAFCPGHRSNLCDPAADKNVKGPPQARGQSPCRPQACSRSRMSLLRERPAPKSNIHADPLA